MLFFLLTSKPKYHNNKGAKSALTRCVTTHQVRKKIIKKQQYKTLAVTSFLPQLAQQ